MEFIPEDKLKLDTELLVFLLLRLGSKVLSLSVCGKQHSIKINREICRHMHASSVGRKVGRFPKFMVF